MKMVLFVSILCLLGFAACAEEASPIPTKTPIIPVDVSYSIIDTDIIPGVKRSLNVRLNKKVSEDVLRAIALELKSKDSRQYERTFILYYTESMTVGVGAWATTHFDPTLEVRILGLTVEEKQALVTKTGPSDAEVIGRWLDDFGFQFTIYRQAGALYMEEKYKGGSILKKELVEIPSSSGQRFDKKEGSGAGDHWIIDGDGNLQVRDNLGLVSTAIRIQ